MVEGSYWDVSMVHRYGDDSHALKVPKMAVRAILPNEFPACGLDKFFNLTCRHFN
ncbi:hypothetical protein BH11ARM2_BH11ARM2_31230 [soil metagenome]